MASNEKVMRALANDDRRRMLEYLYSSGPSTYSEIMRAIGFGIGDSGRFAYHLKKLISAGLVKQLPDSRYTLTPEGRRVAAILHEEELEHPTIIDTLNEFSRIVDIKRFMNGSILVYTGLSFTVTGGILTLMSIIGIPTKIEIMGTAHYFIPNTIVSLTALVLGLISLWMGLGILKHILPGTSILELLIYQKYSFLLLSRSGKLNKYFLMYILVTIAWISVLAIAMF